MKDFMHRIAGGKLLAVAAAMIMTIGGLMAFRALPVDAFPDVTPSLVQVFTETEGLAPEEVERYVTYPIETSMSGLPKLERIRSVSNFGLSVVNIYFEDGTDVYFARQVVAERLGEASEAIPPGFGEPKMGPVSSGLGIIMYFKLVDETGERSLVEMRELQDWVVKYQLQTVKGVTEVLSLGGYEKQYQVRIEPDALLRYDLQIADVTDALERGNKTEGAQFIEIGSEQYTVRGVGLARSIDDLRSTVVKVDDGRPVRVGDIAEIEVGGGVRQGLATSDGQGEVVAGLVLKLYGANTSDVIARVQERFDEINATLPDGVRAVPYYDQGTLVNKAAATVTNALWQGALLVAVIILVFLGGWRPSLVVVLSIPFSVGFAFISMQALGNSANLMSLGGVAIAIGMMVDGAIVIAENVDRALKDHPSKDIRSVVAGATAEVIAPLAAAVAVVIVVFLPLFALQGVEGKTFRPLAASAALAMTGSLIYAVFVAPAVSALLMRAKGSHETKEKKGALGELAGKAASVFVQARWMAVTLAVVLLVLGAGAFSRLGSEFTPAMEEGDILMRITMAPSISLTEAKSTVTRI
ncbi:efflux RND transporter permease subunit, partial [Aquisalinus luteolus]